MPSRGEARREALGEQQPAEAFCPRVAGVEGILGSPGGVEGERQTLAVGPQGVGLRGSRGRRDLHLRRRSQSWVQWDHGGGQKPWEVTASLFLLLPPAAANTLCTWIYLDFISLTPPPPTHQNVNSMRAGTSPQCLALWLNIHMKSE